MSDFIWGFIGFCILIFVFNGEPDVWDKLRDYTNHMPCCACRP